jgi:two-component system CheB/CheR fusion protein
MTRLFNLIQGDIGRPITDITSKTSYQDIAKDSRHVLDTLVSIDKEIETRDNYWFKMRVMPYRTVDNVIDGVVITFVDVTVLKLAKTAVEDSRNVLEEKVKQRTADLNASNEKLKQEITKRTKAYDSLRRMATVVRDSNDAITVQDLDGKILAWNRGAANMYGWKEAEALKMNVRQIVPKEKRKETAAFTKRIKKGEEIQSFETQRVTKEGKIMDVRLVVTKLVDESGRIDSIATTERDITDCGKA